MHELFSSRHRDNNKKKKEKRNTDSKRGCALVHIMIVHSKQMKEEKKIKEISDIESNSISMIWKEAKLKRKIKSDFVAFAYASKNGNNSQCWTVKRWRKKRKEKENRLLFITCVCLEIAYARFFRYCQEWQKSSPSPLASIHSYPFSLSFIYLVFFLFFLFILLFKSP